MYLRTIFQNIHGVSSVLITDDVFGQIHSGKVGDSGKGELTAKVRGACAQQRA